MNKSKERSFVINKNSDGEYYGVKTVYYYAGDINHDGTIDSMDFPIYGEDMYKSGGGKIVSLLIDNDTYLLYNIDYCKINTG